jgi:hypothetical protein
MTMFAIVSILALLAAGLALAYRRFRLHHPSKEGTILHAVIARDFLRWLAGRAPEVVGRPGPGGWAAWVKGFAVWRLPLFEKWFLVCLYGSFLYLAASGFVFAIFVPRGLYGFPLVLHVFAGAVFAVCLTLIVFLRARRFVFDPGPLALPGDLESVRRFRIPWGPREWAKLFFWVFLVAGVSVAASALLPMLPWFYYKGQVILFGWHRWSALASLLSGMAFADLELFAPRPEA